MNVVPISTAPLKQELLDQLSAQADTAFRSYYNHLKTYPTKQDSHITQELLLQWEICGAGLSSCEWGRVMTETPKVTTHTPGPWHYQECADAYTHIIRSANGEFVGSAPQGTSGECRANAKLMAAAPELFEALKAALDRIKQFQNGSRPHCDAAIKFAEFAIDKAEGRS